MKVQILVSTMNKSEVVHLLKEMNVYGDYVVINQVTSLEVIPEDYVDERGSFLSYKEKGLSKSRNKALQGSSSGICVVADDDMHYVSDYEKIIRDAYVRYPNADIISFSVDHEDDSKVRGLKEGPVGLLESMRISSVNITFRRQSIIDSGVIFDERFGAGTDNYMGEENIFLTDCIRAGLKIYSVPVKIATLRESDSTWFRGYDKRYLIVRGRVYRRMFPVLFPILILRFALRKRSLYRESAGLVMATFLMLQGAFSSSASLRRREEQGQ